jgi:hypothetical protein
MNAFSAANTIYVPQSICLKDGPVTITTTKLKILPKTKANRRLKTVDKGTNNTDQLLAVLSALAGARIRKPTISAGYCCH